jgi:hypothetical protein
VIAPAELDRLEATVRRSLATGRADGLRVLGYGEITLVVGWPTDSPTHACKRLPRFPDRASFDRYRDVLDRYVAALTERGLAVWPSELVRWDAPDGTVVGYLVQEALPESSLLPAVLRTIVPDPDHPVLAQLTGHVAAVVDPTLGLDGQVSNWAVRDDGTLVYFDLTTPMLTGPDGRSALDLGLFAAMVPWALRAPLRRFVFPGIVQRYHDPRTVLLDLTANLHKERLVPWVPAVVDAANQVLAPARRPLEQDEVARDYASDARQWELLLRLRRADRWWQQRVRRREYPFLLPGPITR